MPLDIKAGHHVVPLRHLRFADASSHASRYDVSPAALLSLRYAFFLPATLLFIFL